MHLFQRRFLAQPNLLDIVSKLRNETSMSIQICRKAALEAKFDYNVALELLNKSNSTIAQTSTGLKLSFGKDGLIGIIGSPRRKFLIELRCDSDFVAKNSEFIQTAENVLEALAHEKIEDSRCLSSPVQSLIEKCRIKFKENIGIEAIKLLQSDPDSEFQVISDYIHQKHSPMTGKSGALVKLQYSSSIDVEHLKDIGAKIAKQIVALNDQNMDCDKLLKSEYLFSSVGTVKNFMESHEQVLNTKISLEDFIFAKIK